MSYNQPKILILIILVTVFSFSWIYQTNAAPPISGFEGWANTAETKDTQKAWTIKLNKPVDALSIIKDNIFITDEDNNIITTELSYLEDGMSISIKPVSSYEVGKTYRLYINGKLKDKNGKAIKKAKIFTFKVISESSKTYITDVQTIKNSLLIRLFVKCSVDVSKVTAGNNVMNYSIDSNGYLLNILDYNAGDKLIIRAYDSWDNLLETKEYIIP